MMTTTRREEDDDDDHDTELDAKRPRLSMPTVMAALEASARDRDDMALLSWLLVSGEDSQPQDTGNDCFLSRRQQARK